jgi:hypothetical protein
MSDMNDTDTYDNTYDNKDDMNDIDSSDYELKEDDLIFNEESENPDVPHLDDNETDNPSGGGFSLKKAIMKAGVSPLQLVGGNAFGEPTTPNLSSYAVPNWAYSNGGYKKGVEVGRNTFQTETLEDDEYVSDDLHDRLLSLVSVNKNIITNETNKNTNDINNKNKKKSIKKTKKLRKTIQSTKKGVKTTKKKRSNK